MKTFEKIPLQEMKQIDLDVDIEFGNGGTASYGKVTIINIDGTKKVEMFNSFVELKAKLLEMMTGAPVELVDQMMADMDIKLTTQ